MISLADIDLRLIRIFLTVVENEGISASQGDLRMATSTISNHVTTLEARLGTRLCQRGRGGFALTPEGQIVHEAALALYQSVAAFHTQVDSLRGTLSGTLRVGVLDTALTNRNSPLLPAIRRYNQRANSTRLSIVQDDVSSLERLVLGGQLDIAFVGAPRQLDGLQYTYLYDEWQMLYCARSHPLFHRIDAEIGNDVLTQQRMVSRDLWTAIETEKFLSKRADSLINHITTKTELILTGTYIGFLPVDHAESYVKAGQLRQIRPGDFSWATTYYIVRKKGPAASRQLQIFLRDLSSAMKKSIST